MSRMILIRHGQASFLTDDYDRLSELGLDQARRLGAYWREQQLSCDAVFCGPRRRHRETANCVLDCLQNAGYTVPPVAVLEGMDEHHVDQLVTNHIEWLASRSTELSELVAAFELADTSEKKHRTFQRLFEAVARLWIHGEPLAVETSKIEPWKDFQNRVNRALDDIVGQVGRGRTVLVFTSVGPITVAVQRAMQCSDRIALQTGWRLWNGSLTEFVFSGERFSLDSFNTMPHLHRTAWTYR